MNNTSFLFVTSLDDSKQGSLREALRANNIALPSSPYDQLESMLRSSNPPDVVLLGPDLHHDQVTSYLSIAETASYKGLAVRAYSGDFNPQELIALSADFNHFIFDIGDPPGVKKKVSN
ncbi:MAG: hypothetical protein GF344_12710, partial [Chitinivibrionales bacterium]|nr:hypothetical protein [Chitinivibrionales bacterium]